MESEAGRARAARVRRLLQAEQNAPEPWHQVRRETCTIIPFVQCLQSLVPDPH